MKTEVMHENRSYAWKQKLCMRTEVMHENRSYAWKQKLCMKTEVMHENRSYAWKQELCMKTNKISILLAISFSLIWPFYFLLAEN